MIKRFTFLLVLLVIVLFITYRIDSTIKGAILSFSNTIKSTTLALYEGIASSWKHHFYQKEQIERLQKELVDLQRYKLLYKDLQFRLMGLQKNCGVPFELHGYDLKLAKMIAYRTFGDYTTAWLNVQLPEGKIYGLITPRGVAGIVQREHHKSLALFNGNKKCSYTVSIGSGAKGIATGKGDNRHILVKYIQNYEEVKKGDRVYTNSFDGIFPYGIDVGVVEDVWQEGSYKVARVRTFEQLENPLYFWVALPPSNEVIK